MIFESLDPLLHFPGRVTVSMLVEPLPPAQAYQALRQERSSRYAGFIARSQQGRLSEPAAVADLQSMEKELADLQVARRFPLSLYWVIGLSAHDEDELDDLGQKMEELQPERARAGGHGQWQVHVPELGWLALAVGGLTPDERNAVTEGYRRVMADTGVMQEVRSSWSKGVDQMPVLSDLYTALLVEEHEAARDVAARLKEYAVGMYAHAFNARTTINPHGHADAWRWFMSEPRPVGVVDAPSATGLGLDPTVLVEWFGRHVTSGFHDPSRAYHGGIDFGLVEGTPIRSTWGGTVVYAGWSEAGYGDLVIVQNGDWQMYYGHLSAFSVSVGQEMQTGTAVGLSGNAARSIHQNLPVCQRRRLVLTGVLKDDKRLFL